MKQTTSKIVTILAALAGSAVIVMCGPAPAHAAAAEELRELRKQKEGLCLKNPECAGALEAKKQARRDKAADKLRAEIAALRG